MNRTYNSELEAGLRALIVLEAMYPRACTLTEMTWFDYLTVHSADINGPESLHPDLPARGGELLVRRKLVHSSIQMMQRLHLVDAVYAETGVSYRASEDTPSFVDMLQANYNSRLKDVASWIAERFQGASSDEVEQQVGARIGRWTAEFLVGGQPGEFYA